MDRSVWWPPTQRNDALGNEARPTDAKTDAYSEPHETGSEPRKKPAGQQVARAERYRHRTDRMLVDLLGQGISPPINPLAQRGRARTLGGRPRLVASDLRLEGLRALLS
jgi:hypothetical protein